MAMRYDGQVAVVTGAGGGLGRQYALMLAGLGASVVVNDLGVSHSGVGKSSSAADVVVAEIRKAGGKAVANYDSVEKGDAIIKTAIDNFGRIDILINNAGILRDVSFKKMTDKDWDMIMLVHLKGSYSCSRAAWPHMQKQQYGRIVNTASASGLYGNFGQVNYSTAKMGLVGFSKALAKEGEKSNIRVNVIAPLAGTRMTETILPKEIVEGLRPEYVAPVVGYLVHKSCTDTGGVFEVGAGWVSALRWQRTKGVFHKPNFGVGDVAREWKKVTDFGGVVTYPNSMQESMSMVVEHMETMKGSGGAASGGAGAGDVPADEAEAAAALKSYPALRVIRGVLAARGAEIVKMNKVFQFDIKTKSGNVFVFTVNLKEGNGAIISGPNKNPDATFVLSDEVFFDLLTQKIQGVTAMFSGKMKVTGNLGAAASFTPKLFRPELEEWSASL